MSNLKGACIIGQSGGPTSVINSSILGCIEAALDADCITKVYGAAYGIKGVLDGRLYDLTREDREELALLRFTPSAALGSCRYKMKDPEEDDIEYGKILDTFRKYDVRYFFYNGGNDSMDTCNKISRFFLKNDYECRIIGIPKTIDNDLACTDHCPGYGSAAKFIATVSMELYKDLEVYDAGSVTVLEIMGRNAGWLTAASALASAKGAGPDLIYLPEIPFEIDRFIDDVKQIYNTKGKVLVAVSEGIADKDGNYITTFFQNKATKDVFGHTQMGGLASNLAGYAKSRIGERVKVRGIEFSLVQRCAAHIASLTDTRESYMVGRAAFEAAKDGATDKMAAFRRADGPNYSCTVEMVDLKDVANVEKRVPAEWINDAGNGLLSPFIDYAAPLIQGEPQRVLEDGLPRFAKLQKIPV